MEIGPIVGRADYEKSRSRDSCADEKSPLGDSFGKQRDTEFENIFKNIEASKVHQAFDASSQDVSKILNVRTADGDALRMSETSASLDSSGDKSRVLAVSDGSAARDGSAPAKSSNGSAAQAWRATARKKRTTRFSSAGTIFFALWFPRSHARSFCKGGSFLCFRASCALRGSTRRRRSCSAS